MEGKTNKALNIFLFFGKSYIHAFDIDRDLTSNRRPTHGKEKISGWNLLKRDQWRKESLTSEYQHRLVTLHYKYSIFLQKEDKSLYWKSLYTFTNHRIIRIINFTPIDIFSFEIHEHSLINYANWIIIMSFLYHFQY